MKTFINRKIISLSEYSKQYYILNRERILNKIKSKYVPAPKPRKPRKLKNPAERVPHNVAEYNRQYYLAHKEELKKKYKPPPRKTEKRIRIYYNQLNFN
jgi:hypothetical protein